MLTLSQEGFSSKEFLEKELELTRISNELARATDEQLASTHHLESKEAELRELCTELEALRAEKQTLNERVQTLTEQLHKASVKSGVTVQPDVSGSSSSEGNDHTSSSSKNSDSTATVRSQASNKTKRVLRQPHLPGFKEMQSRVQLFSGKRGEKDFLLWLEDYEEVSADCQWSDRERSRWFSWFITGPAKATWQGTLKQADKSSCKKIVEVYKGQYGVHLDPRTAYQRCHELNYDQFGSSQGLLDAMRDYQRMAPQKLTDETLESILWNKVPIELQREVKEITDGLVQELLQQLLRAQAVLAECK